ncbi:surface-adhesin E family protein [Burkholderia cepacia]|uniref:surface-adhesin E family protein n=1 Tax=Burkholderia cepacia TaxID=292 RepID=UPI001CF33818|nr:surface-adhesin E family protein [Burkholderia cepacia]MCA8326193.1 hypothetical protein [Burkholderia cepacia]
MKTLIFGLACGIGIVSGPAIAASWAPIADGLIPQIYVDTASIRHEGKYTKGWFLSTYLEPQKNQAPTYTATGTLIKPYLSEKSLLVADCAARTSTTLQLWRYSGERGTGEVVESQTVKMYPQNFTDVVPDTIGEAMLNRLCRR